MAKETVTTDNDPWYPLATRIRTERIGQGLSVKELADRVDCSRATVHNWEGGRPVPLDKCARIAHALDIDPSELLALHPNSNPPARPRQPLPASRALARTWVVLGILGMTMYVTWATATAECLEVGAGGGSMIGPFREAYEWYGGAIILGCPTNEVHKWGPGYAQDLSGGVAGDAILMTLDRRRVHVLAGPMRRDLYALAGVMTADFTGIATSDPLACGPGVLVLLDGGLDGPGLLVSSADDAYVWVPADFWAVYRRYGGPFGPLGLPESDVVRDRAQHTLHFEHGDLRKELGGPVTVDPPIRVNVEAFSPGRCAPVSVEDVVLGEAVGS